MKVLIDSNILISAALNSNGTPYQAYLKAVTFPNHGLICEQNIDELRRIFNRKFPNRIAALEQFPFHRFNDLGTCSYSYRGIPCRE